MTDLPKSLFTRARRLLLPLNRQGFPSGKPSRLTATIESYEGELEARIARYNAGKKRADGVQEAEWDWTAHAKGMLHRARSAADQGRIDESWRCLNASKRLELFGMKDEELRLEGQRVLKEADRKLRSWRKDSVKAILATKDQGEGKAPTAIQLHIAREILDEHFANTYMKLGLLASRLRVSAIFVAVAIAALFIVVHRGLPDAGPDSVLGNWHRLAVIAALGALGAVLSAILGAVHEEGRIPEVVRQGWIAATRPLVGIAAAIVVVIILETGVTDIVVVSGTRAYPFAIAAGFTERLVTRVLNTIESAAEK